MPKSIPRSEPPAVLRYGAAIAAVAAAVTAGSLLQQAGGNAPVVSLLLCGVLFAAWFGGLGPGLLAIALGVLAFAVFFLPPLYSPAVQDYNDVVRLIVFAIAALFVVALSARQTSMAQSLRRAHADLQVAVLELERANASLRDENAERQRAEAELRQSEKNLQTIVNTIPAHVARYRADGTPDFANQTLREFLGPDAAIDQMRGTVHPDDIRQNWRDWRAHIAAGEPYENEMRLRRADGVYRWHRIRRVPLRDASGTVVNWYGAGYDIDDQKRAETALRESEKSLQTIIDTIPALVVRYRADGAPDFMNQTTREFVGPGVGLEEMKSAVHPDDIPQNLRDWSARVAAGEPHENEMRLRRADGAYRWYHIRRVPLRDESGAIVNWYGAGHDIDDHKRAEQALREREAQLVESRRELLETIDTIPIPVGRYSVDEVSGNTRRDFVNAAWKQYTGLSDEATFGSEWSIVIDPDQIAPIEKMWRDALAKGESLHTEERVRRFDGQHRWFAIDRVAVRDENGKVKRWYGTAYDIEDRKQAELALQQNEAELIEAKRELQQTIDTIPINVNRYGLDGKREFVNAAWKRFTGLSDEAARSTGLYVLVHPDDVEDVERKSREALAKEESLHIETRLRRADGVYRWHAVDRVALRDESGNVTKWYGTSYDIEDRKRAEAAVRESEKSLRTIIDTIPAHVVRYRADGTADFMNQTLREFVALDAGQAGLDGMNSTVHPDDLQQRLRDWPAHVAAGEPYENEMRLRRADGVYRWQHLKRVPLRDATGAIVNWYGAGYDIDDQKRAETALRESEAHLAEAQRELQAMIDTIPAMVGSYDASGSLTYVNKTALDYTGAPEVGGMADRQRTLIHPDDLDQIRSRWRASVATGEPFQMEVRLLRRDGEYRWVSTHRVPLRDGSGKVVRWYGVAIDIEDRKRAEDALRRNEAELIEAKRELQQTIDIIPMQVARYSSDFRRDFVNAAWKQFTGVSDEAAGGTKWLTTVHPDDVALAEQGWRDAALAKGEPTYVEARLRRADGQYRWFVIYRVALRDESGKVIKWYSTGHDIEERKRAEDALRRSEAYLAEAQQLSVTGSFGWCISDNLIVWSQETYRILEIDPAVKPTLDLVFERTHPDDIELVRGTIERLVNEDREFDFEHRLLLPGGTIKHLHVRTHRVRFEGGEVEVVGAVMDVTAAREAEEALRRAQAELAHASRVATLGELSASIVHEVNQPLSSIVASGQAAIRWLDRDVPEKERAHRSILRLLNEAERASQVTRRIRELAKKAEPEMAQVDINGLVEDVVTLVHREAVGHRVLVRTQLASELPPVRGDRIQLQQVLINLVINGIQAMASVTDRARVLVICTQRHSDDELLVAVEDAGVGIAPENLNRLFSAFYTTKPDGMGMGLSISRSIVEAHGGRLSATLNSGPGMTFQFTLSLYREQDAA